MPVPKPAEVSSTSTLDFSTSGQSMWGSGSATEYDNTWNLAGFDTGLHSDDILGGALGYQFQLAAYLQAKLTASTGSIDLDYPLNASFTKPNVAAPGQQFTINTTPAGLGTTPNFQGTLPQITAGIQAQFKGVALLNYDIFGESGSVGIQPFDTTIPLVTLSSGHEIEIPPLPDFNNNNNNNNNNNGGNNGGNGGNNNGNNNNGPGNNSPFKLKFALPTEYADENVSVGNGTLPTETLTADTDSVIAGELDLLQLAAVLIFGPGVQFPSGSIGPLDYTIASLTLEAGIGLAQQFTFVPDSVIAEITAPWGETEDVELGQDATFTVPDTWSQSIELTAEYMLEGNLVSQAGILGRFDLGVELLSGSLGPFDFGPLFEHTFPLASTDPVYLATIGGSGGFALQGFNTVSGGLSIALGNGLVDLPGGATIDTTDFTANSTAVIQTVITSTAGAAIQTNIYDPDGPVVGSATAVADELNIEVVDPAGPFQLPAGFQAGILTSGGGNAELDGTTDSLLLAASPGPGHTDTLKSGGHETLVGGQDGNVNFVIQPDFSGEIVGLHAGDTIRLEGVPFDANGTAQVSSNNVLVVNEGGSTYNIQLHQTEDFTETFFLLGGDTNDSLITIKARPAAPSSLALTAATDSGVQGDGVTNVTEPTITGTGLAGDTVDLFEGTNAVGTAQVGAGGSWSIALANPLSEGDHSLTATLVDSEGVVSNPSDVFAVTVDTTPPDAPTDLRLDSASDSGTKGDNTTDDGTPTINGHGTTGDTITLLENGNSLGTTAVKNSGDWSVTSSTLPIGVHTLTATEVDVAGNTSDPATPALSLTIAPPPIGPTGPNQGFYFNTHNQYVLGTSGADYIAGNSDGSLIDGLDGNNIINISGNNDTINAGNGNDALGLFGNNGKIDAGDGNNIVTAIGDHDTIAAGAGDDFIFAMGTGNLLIGGPGNDIISAIGNNDTIEGGGGTDLLFLGGTGGMVETGFGDSTIFAFSGGNTVTGNGNNTIYIGGGNNTLLDASGRYHDTVMGFSEANGDRIELTTDTVSDVLATATQINFGLDTLITLSDGSTITLKFTNHIDAGFFA